jgi:hypothetical protein
VNDELDALLERYVAKLYDDIARYEESRKQLVAGNAPHRLRKFDTQFRVRFQQCKKQYMEQFRRELADLSSNLDRKTVFKAVNEALARGLIKPWSDEAPDALPLESMNEEVQLYVQRLSETLSKLRPLTPTKRRERLTAEATRFDKLKGWRARDPALSTCFAAYFRHLAALEKPRKRGRQQNETCLSVERAFVNAYLPRFRRPLEDMRVVLKTRDETVLLRTIATESFMLDVTEEGLYTAIRNWDRRNKNSVN